jgi:hypothetical protein
MDVNSTSNSDENKWQDLKLGRIIKFNKPGIEIKGTIEKIKKGKLSDKVTVRTVDNDIVSFYLTSELEGLSYLEIKTEIWIKYLGEAIDGFKSKKIFQARYIPQTF